MHVPERPVDHLRDLQPGDVLRGLEVTRAAELDLAVPALREQERDPTDLQLGTGTDQQIGGADARDQAGTRFDAVRILQRGRGRIDRHLVSPQLLRQGGPFGLAGEYVERRGCRQRNNKRTQREKKSQNRFHVRHLRICGRRARPDSRCTGERPACRSHRCATCRSRTAAALG